MFCEEEKRKELADDLIKWGTSVVGVLKIGVPLSLSEGQH